MKKAVVLLSGGLDSTTALYWAVNDRKWSCLALGFDYGQRHKKELRLARKTARRLGVPLEVVSIRLPWGGSALLDASAPLPRQRMDRIGRDIPSTYVPARNTIFLSFAYSWADAAGADHVVIGANALDYSGYPDCRAPYLKAIERAANLGTKRGTKQKRPIRLWAPLLHLDKAAIVRLGQKWRVPFQDTWSCYKGKKRPCGRCDSCVLRQRGFEGAGLIDPLRGEEIKRRHGAKKD